MKRDSIHIRHNQIRPSFLLKMAVCWLLVSFSACTDEDWSGTEPMLNSNMISFQVTSGITSDMFSEAQSRAADDTTDLLQPLLLKSPELEHPLYLHTYVAEEYERSTGTDAETRGVPVEDMANFVSIAGDRFNVKAWYADTGDEFMPNGTEATPYESNNNEVWSTATKYYWPGNDRKLHFAAYAPQSATNLLTNLSITKENISFDYTVPAGMDENGKQIDAEKQPDLMFAISECSKSESVDGKAPLNFRHALSAIKFAVRDVVDGTIEKITISGVYGNGHCVYQLPETGEDGVFTWSNPGEANSSYSQQFDYKVEGITTPPADEDQDKVLNDKMPEKTFMLIPQEISADAKIEIVFNRKDGQSFTLSGNIRDNNVTKWEPGKEYIYTISTSSSNWTYHFEVIGSDQQDDDSFEESNEYLRVNARVVSGAYYKVKSYRQRANNPNIKVAIQWTADLGIGGTAEFPSEMMNSVGTENLPSEEKRIVPAKTWMPNQHFNEDGLIVPDDNDDLINGHKYPVTFFHQRVGTSWKGDWLMRQRSEFGTPDSPIDLSMNNGGVGKRNTANCYLINAPGYYKLPLVYGNAITNGQTNEECWKCGYSSGYDVHPVLKVYKDYMGNDITEPKIEGAVSAQLVWQDAYNLISDVELKDGGDGFQYLTFKANRDDMQQGNAVLAIKDDSGTIMWSWHIWITEHWTTEGSLVLNEGVACKAYDEEYGTFYLAPYNLGWCDAKSLWYLKRTGTMKFIQAETGDEKVLEVVQKGEQIDYWIGNNAYYQFGRKDPIVGFVNSDSEVKYNFGELPYKISPQPKKIQDGIQNPNILYVGGDNNDWLSTSYYNLWNNTSLTPVFDSPTNIKDYHYSGVKTVYDPSPAGYIVPPVGFFKIITTGTDDEKFNESDFKGKYYYLEHEGFYRYEVDYNGVIIKLTGTGHRWYAKAGSVINYDGSIVDAGENFNPPVVYLWSNQIAGHGNAYGLALGNCTGGASCFCFVGRRSMARPIRSVKEFNR